jgi:hypothetical protein
MEDMRIFSSRDPQAREITTRANFLTLHVADVYRPLVFYLTRKKLEDKKGHRLSPRGSNLGVYI